MATLEGQPVTNLAFLGLWARWLADEIVGRPVAQFTPEQVRTAVKTVEEELENIWGHEPSIPVVARTAVYSILDQLWIAARQENPTQGRESLSD